MNAQPMSAPVLNLHVPIDRHFREITAIEPEDPDHLSAYNENHLYGASNDWPALIKHERVVILAAAGSGKTHELEHQVKRLLSDGKMAFFAPLEEVAKEGFVERLYGDELTRYNNWLTGNQPAWFFLDAVDELKLVQGKLKQALRRLRQAIDGHLDRSHLIISSRPTDWITSVDDQTVLEFFPIVQNKQERQVSSDEVFLKTIRRDRCQSTTSDVPKDKPTGNKVCTVLLLPMADRHIRSFAHARGVLDCDSFIAEIARNNSWSFARRPLDLDDLIALWTTKGRLGTRLEQHEYNVSSKLKDKLHRPDADLLTDLQAVEGAERLALALAVTRNRTIQMPVSASLPTGESLDSREVLRDWTDDQRGCLLRRALFDPATFGRVRFHHRSVQEFLAAQRLLTLRTNGMSIKALFQLLFAEKYGEQIVIPSMRPIAAWLAIRDTDVCAEVIRREPDLLLEHGDPSSLFMDTRVKVIRAFVERFGSGGWRGIRIPSEQLERIASPELATTINECWGAGPENAEVRDLLLDLILKGRAMKCMAIARKVSRLISEPINHRVTAIQALHACGQNNELRRIAGEICGNPTKWPDGLVSGVLPILFPSFLTSNDLETILRRRRRKKGRRNNATELDELHGGDRDCYRWPLMIIIDDHSLAVDRAELRRLMTELVVTDVLPFSSKYDIKSRHRDLCPLIARLCLMELETKQDAKPNPGLIKSCAAAYRLTGRGGEEDDLQRLRKHFEAQIEWRADVFWEELSLMDALVPNESSWNRFWDVQHNSLVTSLNPGDEGWLLHAALDQGNADRREVALHGWIWIWRSGGRKNKAIEAFRKRLRNEPLLLKLLEENTKTREPSANERRHELQAKQQQAKWDAERAKNEKDWMSWRSKLLASPDEYFSEVKVRNTIQNLYKRIEHYSPQNASHAVWNYHGLVEMFGEDVANRARRAFSREWRQWKPELWSERVAADRNSTPYVWLYGMCGVMAEAEAIDWATKLTHDDAKLAARYATVEMNGFASFITVLAMSQPTAVECVLGDELVAELQSAGTHSHLPVLQDLTHSDKTLKHLLLPRLLTFLESTVIMDGGHWNHNLEEALGILNEVGTTDQKLRASKVCIKRFKSKPKGSLSLTWLRGIFRFAPQQGVNLFVKKRSAASSAAARKSELGIIAGLFGSWSSVGLQIVDTTERVKALGKLIRYIYGIVRPEDDAKHEGSFTPDVRDEAESARGSLLSALLDTPGAASQQLLLELATEPAFQHFPDRLRHLARERAAKDAEFEAWPVKALAALDRDYELPPIDAASMFALLNDRLGDLQHHISHDDFSDRVTLAGITKESEMQKAIALKLREMRRSSYTIVREDEVADRKEPDIRLVSVDGKTKAAIEVKIADGRWSLKQLEEALSTQLTKQYLRHQDCRAGCLLLTYNGATVSWKGKGNTQWVFADVVKHLSDMAAEISRASGYVIKITVFGLDLTGGYPIQ
ncbi:hypothetical protein BH11VER1_BH11VER1_29430 [soil metagenome]